MLRRNRRRLCAAIASVAGLVPLLVVASPTAVDAASLKRHDVNTYKYESWLAVDGGATVEPQVACESGDIAVDGMWKVDAYDGDARSLRVLASHAHQTDPQAWSFRFVNAGTGRAQVKVFVTCLSTATGEAHGHHHDLVVSARTVEVRSGLAAGSADLEHAAGCHTDQIPVAPGFEFVSGSGAVVASRPSADLRSWRWQFLVTGPSVLALSIVCLDERTTPAGVGGHVHAIDGQLSTLPGEMVTDLAPGVVDRTVPARKQDDGIVGAFFLPDPHHVAYLGQDPQGQVRGFRFQVAGPDVGSAWIGVWGIDKRTSRQLAP